jgi:AcrR family transcriptional regulator
MPETDDAILAATLEVLAECGTAGTTMSEVIRRSGVARATVYLRWPNRDALIVAAIRRAMRKPPMRASGDLEADLARAVQQVHEIFAQPTFRAVLPALVAGWVGTGRDAAPDYDVIAPGRTTLADEYREIAPSAGMRNDIDAQLVADLIIGTHLSHLLATGQAPDEEASRQILEVVLDGLRLREPSRS